MTNLEIFNDIEKLAKEVQEKLGYQPLSVWRKITNIIDLAELGQEKTDSSKSEEE